MKTLSPHSPLLTLSLTTSDETKPVALLARFHPIMKELGFGHFNKQEDWLYSASKPGASIFRASDNVFAELKGNQLFINIEGESIFGLKSVEQHLLNIKQKYEASIACSAHIDGPDYKAALLSNLVFTGLPILSGSVLALFLAYVFYGYNVLEHPIIVVYMVMGTIATKTRFWIMQRKKNRPTWVGALMLFLLPLGVLAILALLGLLFQAIS